MFLKNEPGLPFAQNITSLWTVFIYLKPISFSFQHSKFQFISMHVCTGIYPQIESCAVPEHSKMTALRQFLAQISEY